MVLMLSFTKDSSIVIKEHWYGFQLTQLVKFLMIE